MRVFLLEQDLCWIEVKGTDSRKFLNGILTNNIQKLQGKSGNYNLFLTPKGKIIADCFCYHCGDHFGITCTAAIKPALLENLKKYVVFQKVELIDPSEKWGVFSLLGEGTQGVLPEDPQLHIVEKFLWGLPCLEVWAHKEKILGLKTKCNLPSLSKEEGEVLRIESATPLFGIDFDENTIPQEAGLYSALSFDKGCYVGQEIVARLEHRGHVGKQLVQFICEDKNPPAQGEKILSTDNQEIGVVTSSCFSPERNQAIGLGYLRYQFLNLTEAKIGGTKAQIKTFVKDKV